MKEKTVFERIIEGSIPCYKVYEDENVLAFLSKGQQTKGHTLVVPKRHSRNILDIEESDLLAVMTVVRKLSVHIYKTLGATGLKIQQNNEERGGQEVFHTHFHIIPLYGDNKIYAPNENIQLSHDELVELAQNIYLEP